MYVWTFIDLYVAFILFLPIYPLTCAHIYICLSTYRLIPFYSPLLQHAYNHIFYLYTLNSYTQYPSCISLYILSLYTYLYTHIYLFLQTSLFQAMIVDMSNKKEETESQREAVAQDKEEMTYRIKTYCKLLYVSFLSDFYIFIHLFIYSFLFFMFFPAFF